MNVSVSRGNVFKTIIFYKNNNEIMVRFFVVFTGQPDNVGNNEDCLVAMTPFDRAGQLNDAPCNSLKGYICQSGTFMSQGKSKT